MAVTVIAMVTVTLRWYLGLELLEDVRHVRNAPHCTSRDGHGHSHTVTHGRGIATATVTDVGTVTVTCPLAGMVTASSRSQIHVQFWDVGLCQISLSSTQVHRR